MPIVPINAPQIGKEEIDAVVKVLESGTLTHGLGAGPMVRKFEDEFAKFAEAKHAIAVNSGTAALHLAVLAVGIKSGDEVILPSFTFTATAEAVAFVGAKPVFVDIDPETYNVSPEQIEKAITKKTKAIIAVDLYGLSSDMQQIRKIAEKHGLKVIEDAAQAHGATYRGKPPGAFADAACWSFYASKNMTTGEGGMVTTNDDEIAEKIRCMRSHGEKEKYASIMLGYNYRMPEMEAAIGSEQLKKLPGFVAKRRENAERLTKILESAERLKLPREPKGYRHSWYLYTVRLKDSTEKERNNLVEKLARKGIEARVFYANPIHLMPYYRSFGKFSLPETEKASKQVFSLPVHPGVTPEQIDFICEAVLHALK
ncbi:MAG: DegT/DnrJ/EryC1/StrS family aminotransferase [Candidatus Bathyarchaeia archaeon]